MTDERIYAAMLRIDLGRGSFAEVMGGVVELTGSDDDWNEGFGHLSLVWDF